MQVSGTGAGVGALLGALGRALVVIFWLGPQAGIIALPSAGIGLLVGAIAGSLGRPLRGALVGFVLSAFVFELFMCACASVLGDLGSIVGGKDAGMAFLTAVLPYTLLMGVLELPPVVLAVTLEVSPSGMSKTAAGLRHRRSNRQNEAPQQTGNAMNGSSSVSVAPA
jgi:hypothetical protein